MGQAIAQEIAAREDCILTAGLVRQSSAAPANGVLLSSDIDAIMQASDVIIDFTLAEATPAYAQAAAKHKKAFVSGTTGLSAAAQATLQQVSASIPVLYAPNTSLSLAAMKQITRLAAKLLAGFDYDIAILDEHHRQKKDAPSGTALALGAAVTQGNAGMKQPSYAAIRAGHIIGNHEVIFTGKDETIRLQHSVTDRGIFAHGAVQAALWLAEKPAGFYSMDDVLEM